MTYYEATIPATRLYAQLTVRLHELNAANVDADDALYDALDASGHELTGAEIDRVNGLSIDLYGVEEGLKPVAMTAGERADWERSCRRAFAAKDYDDLLTRLRRPPDDVPPQDIYAQQGWCWDGLGAPEVALAFLKRAAELDPRYFVAAVSLLRRAGGGWGDVEGYLRSIDIDAAVRSLRDANSATLFRAAATERAVEGGPVT